MAHPRAKILTQRVGREFDTSFLDGLKLSHQERMFVLRYVELLNASEAARRAGYSHKSARVQASRLLTKANIRLAIGRTRKALEISNGITVSAVLERWWAIANSSPTDIIQSRRIACRYR